MAHKGKDSRQPLPSWVGTDARTLLKPSRGIVDVLEQVKRTISVPSRLPRQARSTMWIALAGALAYSSWPLAFLVNPSLAGSALASSFEARSQPFSWLFILFDCVAGLCAAIVCIRELRPRQGGQRPGRALVFALLGYGVFGMATAADAVVPLHCGSMSARACASQLWPLTPDDWLTGVAMLALFAAAAMVAAHMTRRPVAWPSAVPVTATVALIGWSALGLVVLLGGSATVTAVSQYAFLTVTSILAFAVPLGATSSRQRSVYTSGRLAIPLVVADQIGLAVSSLIPSGDDLLGS